jgi:hypothetical protein
LLFSFSAAKYPASRVRQRQAASGDSTNNISEATQQIGKCELYRIRDLLVFDNQRPESIGVRNLLKTQ